MYQSVKRITKKEILKASKDFMNTIIQGSLKKKFDELNTETIEEWYGKRFNELKRKYGYNICLQALPDVLKRIELQPIIILTSKHGDRIELNLIHEPLSEYYDYLAFNKVNGLAHKD